MSSTKAPLARIDVFAIVLLVLTSAVGFYQISVLVFRWSASTPIAIATVVSFRLWPLLILCIALALFYVSKRILVKALMVFGINLLLLLTEFILALAA